MGIVGRPLLVNFKRGGTGMNSVLLITVAGIRNNLRQKIALFIIGAITIICVAGIALVFCTQFIGPEVKSGVSNRAVLEANLGLVLYVTSLLGVGITLNAFAFQPLVKEKARGNLQSLLATPLQAGDIWVGKSLGVFLPGLVLSILMTLAALFIINALYFLPDVGFLVTPWMVLTSFIAVPLIYLLLGLLVHLVGLTSKTANGNVIAQIFLPVFITLVINLLVRHILDASSWLFMAVNLSLAAIIGVIVLFARRRLTPEKIILSGQ